MGLIGIAVRKEEVFGRCEQSMTTLHCKKKSICYSCCRPFALKKVEVARHCRLDLLLLSSFNGIILIFVIKDLAFFIPKTKNLIVKRLNLINN